MALLGSMPGKQDPKGFYRKWGGIKFQLHFITTAYLKTSGNTKNRGKKKRIGGNNINNMKRLLYRVGNGQATFNYKIVDYKHFKRVVSEPGNNKINFQTCCNYYKSLKHFIRFLKHQNQRLMTEDRDHIVKYLKIELTGTKDVGHYLSGMASDERKDRKLEKVP